MRLTADMRLTRKRLGGKIVGDAFADSVKPLVQHVRASSKYFGERHLWPHIYKQIWRPLIGEIILTLEQEEGNSHDSLLKQATVLGHVPQSFHRCFGTSSGTERPLHRETITCEVTSKKRGRASSLRSLYYWTRFSQSSSIKRMCLTRYWLCT